MDKSEIVEHLDVVIDRLDVYTDELGDAIDSWESGEISTDDLREAIMEEIVEDFEFDIEVSANVSCCCDSFYDRKLSEGFRSDKEIAAYLEKDCSELEEPMIEEFTRGFSILCVMEELGMHAAAMDFLTNLAKTIDWDLDRRCFFNGFVNRCLKVVSDRMHDSIQKGSSVAWMSGDPYEEE